MDDRCNSAVGVLLLAGVPSAGFSTNAARFIGANAPRELMQFTFSERQPRFGELVEAHPVEFSARILSFAYSQRLNQSRRKQTDSKANLE